MKMKSGHIWILLVLATAASASSPEQQKPSEIPLLALKQLDESNKLSLIQPVALTQQEKQWAEYFTKGVLKGNKTPPALTSEEQEQLMHLTLHLKGHINKAKRVYQQVQVEQKKQWGKQEADKLNLEQQQWWESLTPYQKEHWKKYTRQQQEADVHLQNEILETWGENIAEMTRFVEIWDTDHPDTLKRQN